MLGLVARQWLEPLDPAHDQPTGHVLELAAASERDEGHLGNLGVGDPALFDVLQTAYGYSIGARASSPMPAIAATTCWFIRVVTLNQAPRRIAVSTKLWQ